ncbi:MAG: SUMF1/EgtB/PvdO family nonheme iron enzyme [Nitrospira sp.]
MLKRFGRAIDWEEQRQKLKPRIFLIIVLFALLGACFSRPPEGMVAIPAGEFIMGTDEVDESNFAAEQGIVKPWFVDEGPSHKIFLPLYYIDQHEVTNAEYAEYVLAEKVDPPPYWEKGRYPQGGDHFPVVMVSWGEAQDYCRSKEGHLPSEAEWEKAARGVDGRPYPWGTEFDIQKVNVGGSSQDLKPVGSYVAGKSPYEVFDMIGNAWEWTADWYQPYPGSKHKSKDYGRRIKVLRGNSWSSIGHFPEEIHSELVKHHSTVTFRLFAPPDATINDVGFRCVRPS